VLVLPKCPRLTNNRSSLRSVTIVSIVRLYFMDKFLVDTNPDINYSLGFCVSAIECNLAIITACGPAMWPLLRTWMPRLFTSYRSSNRNGDAELIPSVNRTPGGSAKPMNLGSWKEIKDVRGDNVRGKTFISASRPDESDEEVLMMHDNPGITRTTDYSVVRENNANRGQDAASSSSVGKSDVD
jgi:hypothetical protein